MQLIREAFPKKFTLSFGYCPNYPLAPSQATWATFLLLKGVKINLGKGGSSLHTNLGNFFTCQKVSRSVLVPPIWAMPKRKFFSGKASRSGEFGLQEVNYKEAIGMQSCKSLCEARSSCTKVMREHK